jgi:hypothetical protein
MGIKKRNKMCDIEGEYMRFNTIILPDRVYLGQISL